MRFYVYIVFVNGAARYVGKGSGRRAESHLGIVRSIVRRRAAGETVHASHFHNRLAKAWRSGADIQIEIVEAGLSEEAAYLREIELIASSSGLWNKTLGGDAPPRAVRRTAKQRAAIRKTNLQTWSDPELRARQSEMKKIHWLRPEYRDQLSKPRTLNHERLSAVAKKRWANPEFRSKMTAIFTSDEHRQKTRANANRYWASDDGLRRRRRSNGGLP